MKKNLKRKTQKGIKSGSWNRGKIKNNLDPFYREFLELILWPTKRVF